MKDKTNNNGEQNLMKIKRKMSNYMSFGVESRIGYGF